MKDLFKYTYWTSVRRVGFCDIIARDCSSSLPPPTSASCLKILPKPQQMERLWELAVLPPCYRGLILWKNSCLGTVGNNSYLTGKQSGKANIMSCLRSWQVGTSITWQTSKIFNKEIQGRKQPNRAWLRTPFSLVVWKAVYILQRSDRMSYLLPVLRWFSLSHSPCV